MKKAKMFGGEMPSIGVDTNVGLPKPKKPKKKSVVFPTKPLKMKTTPKPKKVRR